MTAYFPPAGIQSAPIFTSVAAGDNVTLLQPYYFISTNSDAVLFTHANNTLLNMTTLMSAAFGVFVDGVADCEIINTATGTIANLAGVTGYSAIYLDGARNSLLNAGDVYSVNGTGVFQEGFGSVIDNSGRIQGWDYGVRAVGVNYSIVNSGTIECGTGALAAVDLGGSGSGKSLVNTGVIQALSADGGVAVSVDASGLTTIHNSGTILSAGSVAIYAATATGTMHLTNAGAIIGPPAVTAVIATNQSDIIINTGSINGSVNLGGGDDLFDGTHLNK